MSRFILIIITIGTFALPVLCQEDIKSKHAAYFQCINNIGPTPYDAYRFCSDYLKRYPQDDPRLVEFAGSFVTAFEHIDAYLKSIPPTDFIEAENWSIYKPDLLRSLPWIDETNVPHKIRIVREFGSPEEEKLLNRAEAVYGTRRSVIDALFRSWRSYDQPSAELPSGEPRWWSGPMDSVLSAELVTTSAVRYYYDLSLLLRSNDNKIKENSFVFSSSELDYKASIKRADSFKRSGKSFRDVYVAEMNLKWGQICGGLCGHGFTRNKVVVLRADGTILAVFLDDPVNNTSWVS